MKVFVTGATGYIGGSVAERLLHEGHAITGLVRSDSGAEEIEARGMRAVLGTLDDFDVIARVAREAEAVFDTVEANHPGVVDAIASAVRGSGKLFLHTSGSGIVATDAGGEPWRTVGSDGQKRSPGCPPP